MGFYLNKLFILFIIFVNVCLIQTSYLTMSISINQGDSTAELTTGSFWEISQFKRTVQRIDNGPKVCDDLLNFIKERANIEENYSKMLRSLNVKYRKVIEKNASYNTQQASWLQMLNEAERTADLHTGIKENLMTDPYEKVKAWKKENFHSFALGGLKESKQSTDEFSRAQKQWAKLYKKVQESKKQYFNICKEEKTAQIQESTAKSDPNFAPEKLKKLQETVEKKEKDKARLMDKYESALVDLDRDQPRYMEDMERAFERCQDNEKKRLIFFKQMFEIIHKHLDLSNNPAKSPRAATDQLRRHGMITTHLQKKLLVTVVGCLSRHCTITVVRKMTNCLSKV